MSTPNKTFADQLQKIMAYRGIPQDELAAELDVSQAAVSKWTRGSVPRPKALRSLADYFGVDPEWLTDALGRGPISSRGEHEPFDGVNVIKNLRYEAERLRAIANRLDDAASAIADATKR